MSIDTGCAEDSALFGIWAKELGLALRDLQEMCTHEVNGYKGG